jgi:hypothetical protein
LDYIEHNYYENSRIILNTITERSRLITKE